MFDLICNFLEHTQWHTHVCNTQSGLFHPMHQLSNCHVNIFATPGPTATYSYIVSHAKSMRENQLIAFFHFAGSHQQFCKWKFLLTFWSPQTLIPMLKMTRDLNLTPVCWPKSLISHTNWKLYSDFIFSLFSDTQFFPMHFFIRSEMSTERRVWKLC